MCSKHQYLSSLLSSISRRDTESRWGGQAAISLPYGSGLGDFVLPWRRVCTQRWDFQRKARCIGVKGGGDPHSGFSGSQIENCADRIQLPVEGQRSQSCFIHLCHGPLLLRGPPRAGGLDSWLSMSAPAGHWPAACQLLYRDAWRWDISWRSLLISGFHPKEENREELSDQNLVS